MPDELDQRIAEDVAFGAIGRLQPKRGGKVVSSRAELRATILELIQEAYAIGVLAAESRERLMTKLRPLETAECPFANLPEARSGRWGDGLTAEKMKECVWMRPELVAEVEFVEWTPDGHLRHARFVGLKGS